MVNEPGRSGRTQTSRYKSELLPNGDMYGLEHCTHQVIMS